MRRVTFTLIEMLTVVVVAAILLSLLLPAIGAARLSSQKAVCRSNLRQFGVASLLFADDNKGKLVGWPFVYGWTPPASTIFPPGYAAMKGGYNEIPADGIRVNRGGLQWVGLGILYNQKYLPGGDKTFHCPTTPGTGWSFSGPNGFSQVKTSNEIIGSYIYQTRKGTAPGWSYGGPISASDPGITPVCADTFYGGSYFANYINHQNGYNVLYLDGSVSWVSNPNNTLSRSMDRPNYMEVLGQTGFGAFSFGVNVKGVFEK